MCGKKEAEEPQPPLYGMMGKAYVGTFIDIKDPSQEENDETEANDENIGEEENNYTLEDEDFWLHDMLD